MHDVNTSSFFFEAEKVEIERREEEEKKCPSLTSFLLFPPASSTIVKVTSLFFCLSPPPTQDIFCGNWRGAEFRTCPCRERCCLPLAVNVLAQKVAFPPPACVLRMGAKKESWAIAAESATGDGCRCSPPAPPSERLTNGAH